MTTPTGRPRRLPLRWRVAVAFALASLLVTGLLALVTWNLASNYMLDQRRQSAMSQFAANSRLVEDYLHRHPPTSPTADPATMSLDQALPRLQYDQADTVALRSGGRWVVDGPLADPATIATVSAELLGSIPTAGMPIQRVVHGQPVLASATAVPGEDGSYLELSALGDLDQTLHYIRSVLLAGIGASLLLGLMLGRWAGREALRPLAVLTRTAGRVAGGDLRARLPEQGDADLATLAASFNRTTAALEQRVARDARFAGDVSHELRSPLTTMINAAAVLNRRQGELSAIGQQALALLTVDIQRFRRMVIDLLEISRGHSGDEQDLEPCDFADLVRHTLEARHESLPLEVDRHPPLVLADRRRLERVVANLLDNAAQHAGGVIRVAVSRRGGSARLEVDDAGPGIPVELRERVFERFTRGDRSGDRGDDGGSGLGLALVAQHVRGHAGTVWVEDRPGGGSRFVVELPVGTGRGS